MGVLAGRLTETEFSAGAGSTDPDSTTVGFVGGVDSPVIRRFQAGFEAGVDYASDNVDVTTSYVGSYADPSGGQEAALSMYQNGVDIVYHASGATGVGVFQAAQAEGRFAFGVDQDQSISNESFRGRDPGVDGEARRHRGVRVDLEHHRRQPSGW